MKRIIYVIILCCLSFSCKRDISEFNQKTTERYLDGGNGELDILGYGYDVINGAYADSESKTRKVIDVQKMYAERPSKIDVDKNAKNYFEMRSGEDFEEYTKSYNIKWNDSFGGKIFGLKLFKIDLNRRLEGTETVSSTFSYATVDNLIQRKVITLYDDDYFDIVTNYLTDEFRADCGVMTASQLIDKYGFVVLKKLQLGGKLLCTYRSQINSGTKKTDVEVGAKASVSFLFSVDVDISGSTSNTSTYKHTNQLLKYQTLGGGGNSIQGSTALGSGVTTININNWSSSVTDDNAQLIGFYEDSFIPLFKLVPAEYSSLRNELIKKHFEILYPNGINRPVPNFEGDFVRFNQDDVLNGDDFNFIFLNTYNGVIMIDGYLNPYISNEHPMGFVDYMPLRDNFKVFINNYLNTERLNKMITRYVSKTSQMQNLIPEDAHDLSMTFFPPGASDPSPQLAYPRYKRTVRLVKDTNTNQVYLNIKYDYLANSVTSTPHKDVLYPINSSSAIIVHNFNINTIVNISGTSGYTIGTTIY